MESNHIIKYDDCCACGACASQCHADAITLVPDSRGNLFPKVDETACINCGMCKSVCPCNSKISGTDTFLKTFIGYYEDEDTTILSSSGGIFAAIAKHILEEGGAVFGAAAVYENNKLLIKHIRIENDSELKKIQGSKYVHSLTQEVFSEVRDLLTSGRTVLFSGTSCQVMALRTFLGKDYKQLYTVDLVCHGVPENLLLDAYISYLEHKWKCRIIDIAFRNKKAPSFATTKDSYVLTLKCENIKTGSTETRYIEKYKSAYYKLFLSRACYRENCYSCPYATLDKPSDITLGDFRPTASEYETMVLSKDKVYSSILVHTKKGEALLSSIPGQTIPLIEISQDKMREHHYNLVRPSVISPEGKRLAKMYQTTGFSGLQFYVDIYGTVKRIMKKM